MAIVGDKLASPEVGWKRIDDNDRHIVYENGFNSYSYDVDYNSTRHMTTSSNSVFKLYLFTKNIRLICGLGYIFSNNIEVDINKKDTEYFSCYNSGYSDKYKMIMYEKNFDNYRFIEFTVKTKNSGYFLIDCVDINEDGFLMTYDDYIKYTDDKLIRTSNSYIGEENYPLTSNY